MRRFMRPLPLIAAAVLVAACGGAATTAPAQTTAPAAETDTPAPTEAPATAAPTASAVPTTPSADDGMMVVDAAGFAMPLAEGWRSLPLDGTAEDILALLPADSRSFVGRSRTGSTRSSRPGWPAGRSTAPPRRAP